MKCVSSNKGTVIRATNDEAEKMVESGLWTFTSKKDWKENVRDVKKEK